MGAGQTESSRTCGCYFFSVAGWVSILKGGWKDFDKTACALNRSLGACDAIKMPMLMKSSDSVFFCFFLSL